MTTMNTVEYFRNKYINYNNQTPNEPRYKKDGLLDDITYYPLAFTYYNIYNKNLLKLPFITAPENKEVEEKWFLNRLHDQQIDYAIKFLQVEALKKFIIKNHKSVLFVNPFYQLFYTHYPVDKNLEAAKKIIQILIDNYDDHYELITKLSLPNKEMIYIMDLLYEFLPDDPDNLCSICLQTEPKKLLINICNCKTGAHTNCLIKLNEHKPLDKCSVCKGKYKINQPVVRTQSGIIIKPEKEKLFFPYNDIYREPLMSSDALNKYVGMSRLTMAIIYLQVERVKELLNEKEILDNLSTYYFGYEGYKQTPIHAICTGNLPSNAHFNMGDNDRKYYDILILLLKTKKINLEQKDAFDKTPMDYVIQYRLNALRMPLITYDFFKVCKLDIINKDTTNKDNLILIFNYSSLKYILFEKSKSQMKKYFVLEKIMNDNNLYYTNNENNNAPASKRFYRSSKISHRIFDIITKINKLADGKIKKYQVFNKLELEILCNYLVKNNILHTIIRESNNTIYNKILYSAYKQKEEVLNHIFNHNYDDLEYNSVYSQYQLYIKVYKGFNNLNPNIKDNKNTDYKFGVYIWQ